MLTIGEVSKMFNVPVSTLRYYDREGLFPNLIRKSGIRQFSNKEIESIYVFECLKSSGLTIKEIKQFLDLVDIGNESLYARKQLFEKQRKHLEIKIAALTEDLNMAKYKCWYYEKALELGSEEAIHSINKDEIPDTIKKYYEKTHK